ncbi:hypothetical protein [Brevundimonas sp.]|jgi:hypothetical protein|uniref:hypothetical protein n=1 Tax=Brevundimonas sp. TaxID=1871086 RepID=UPI002E12B51F|nr:hypothetical protein [Brevundimonas sp.]
MAIETLKLDGDTADELAGEVEAAFGVRFVNELADVVTVGDLHARLMDRQGHGDGACATSMSFYRLRDALRKHGMADPITPSSPLFTGRSSPRAFLRQIGIASGLRLDGPAGLIENIGVWIGMVGFVAMVVSGIARSGGLLAVGMFLVLVAFGLGWLDKGRLPRGVLTVGDLARHAVSRNHGSLIVQGAAARDREVWASVQRIVADGTGRDAGEIMAETRFLDSKAKRAA